MDSTYKKQMVEQGATLIILGLPEGSEFGIDLQSWNIGPKFNGIKMIPPGLHFIYFSTVSKQGEIAPRTGIFHNFELKEVLVKKYNPSDEDLYDEEDYQTLENIKLNLKELDRGLGPFPFESWTKWISLTQHIGKTHLERMVPQTGKICSAPELINEDNKRDIISVDDNSSCEKAEEQIDSNQEENVKVLGSVNDISQNKVEGVSPVIKPTLPSMIVRPGTEIRFTKFPLKPYKQGATPSEISRGNIDSSYTMNYLFEQLERPLDILPEVQFSFICFLVGQVWDSWEHWRKLIIALCTAEDTLIENPSLYIEFLSILHYEIQEVPEDLFADIVESKNFLVASLRTFFANITDNKLSLSSKLVSKADKFQGHLISKFKWHLELEDEDEDLPVIVQL